MNWDGFRDCIWVQPRFCNKRRIFKCRDCETSRVTNCTRCFKWSSWGHGMADCNVNSSQNKTVVVAAEGKVATG